MPQSKLVSKSQERRRGDRITVKSLSTNATCMYNFKFRNITGNITFPKSMYADLKENPELVMETLFEQVYEMGVEHGRKAEQLDRRNKK